MTETSALELLPGGAPEKKQPPDITVDIEQRFTIRCECGRTGGVILRHYERVRCECGLTYWALRPKRNGPLKLFPWPGDETSNR